MEWLIVVLCLVGIGLLVLAGRIRRRSIHGLHGEGNPVADRRYREGATEFAASEKAAPAAREARDALDRPAEAAELERARRESAGR